MASTSLLRNIIFPAKQITAFVYFDFGFRKVSTIFDIKFCLYGILSYLCVGLNIKAMIAEFTVRNFSSIKDAQTLSFIPSKDDTMRNYYCVEVAPGMELLKIGLIYGSNASGKSNLINALSFLRFLMVNDSLRKADSIPFMPFLLDDVSKDDTTSFSLTFYLNRERYVLNIEIDSRRIRSEELSVYFTNRPTLLYRRTYKADDDSSSISFGNQCGLKTASRQTITGLTLNNRSVIAAVGMANVERSRLSEVYDYFSVRMKQTLLPETSVLDYAKRYLEKDRSGKLRKFILKLLKASDFNITDFEMSEQDNGEEIVFSHSTGHGNKNLPEEAESRGTQRYMGMAVVLNNLVFGNVIIPFDEIEASIHYELLAFYLKVFLANGRSESQLIATTHDVHLLDESFIRRDTIWFTDKNDDGETQLLRLSGMGLHKNVSPYNAYMQEKLVNLPFMDSPFINFEDDNNGK